jgi:light-regulated signal transduction histidine kinase (bacteriophytochrome)
MYDEGTGQLLEYFCYSLDITERKDAEKKLQETVRALRRYNDELKQFGFVVSHDLKTPLRNISTYLQILQRQVQLDDHSNELIGEAVKSVKHMNSMIQDIFMYASSEQADLKCD